MLCRQGSSRQQVGSSRQAEGHIGGMFSGTALQRIQLDGMPWDSFWTSFDDDDDTNKWLLLTVLHTLTHTN